MPNPLYERVAAVLLPTFADDAEKVAATRLVMLDEGGHVLHRARYDEMAYRDGDIVMPPAPCGGTVTHLRLDYHDGISSETLPVSDFWRVQFQRFIEAMSVPLTKPPPWADAPTTGS